MKLKTIPMLISALVATSLASNAAVVTITALDLRSTGVFGHANATAGTINVGPGSPTSIAITYTNTNDAHHGALLSFESLLNKNLFYTYAVGASQSHFFEWEYVCSFDMGYRFLFPLYQPDLRIGFGYLFGNYKAGALSADKELMGLDEMEVHLSTYIKLGLLNWSFPDRYHLP